MRRPRLLAGPFVALLALGLMPPSAQATPTQVITAAPTTVPSMAAARGSTVVRVATFNVRTARATGDRRRWLKRAPDVAREILSRNPGIVALQELGPGRADGRRGKLKGHLRQTTSLTKTLKRLGGGRYRLVRSTSYFPSGTKHGTQGTRILYDSSRYALITRCPETTRGRNYNRSCAFDLPIARGESLQHRRSAAYAEFRQRRSGKRFFVVSAHLDHRHSGNNRIEAKYNRLRARQAAAVARKLNRINSSRRPVVFGGDINSWQSDRSRHAPRRALVARGYRDAAATSNRINHAYTTSNQWRVRLQRSGRGVGPRLDLVLVKGGNGSRRYENKMARVDRSRPSDHNMVVADVVL